MNNRLQLEHESYKLLITGLSGCGKTTYWLKSMLGYKARLKFVFDHKGEVSVRLRTRPCLNYAELKAAIPSGWCIFNPSIQFKGKPDAAFLFFSDFAYEVSSAMGGTKLFCCDELQERVDTNSIPQEFSQVVYDGRIRGLDLCCISSEPNAIHNRVRGQMTEVVTFRLEEDNALKWLAARGFVPDRVRNLRRFEFMSRDNRGRETAGTVTDV